MHYFASEKLQDTVSIKVSTFRGSTIELVEIISYVLVQRMLLTYIWQSVIYVRCKLSLQSAGLTSFNPLARKCLRLCPPQALRPRWLRGFGSSPQREPPSRRAGRNRQLRQCSEQQLFLRDAEMVDSATNAQEAFLGNDDLGVSLASLAIMT